MTEQERNLIRDAMMFAVKDMTGRVMREATVQSMIDDFIKAINYTHCCKSDSEQLNVSFNVGDKVMFDNKKAVVLWTSVKYLDIEILGTNKILQGVHTSKVLPR